MAAVTFTGAGWIPIETNPDVIHKVQQTSAVERFGHHVPMSSQTKWTPRSGGVELDRWEKGASAPADESPSDSVLLNADKIGGKVTVDEEDVSDSLASIVDAKSVDAGSSYGKLFDNICLGVTEPKSKTKWGFDSLYYLLTQDDPVVGYAANEHLTLAGAAGITYDSLSELLGQHETSDWFDESQVVVIAHPSFKQVLRGIKNADGDPIFQESTAGVAGGGQAATPSKLFGYDLQFSMGAKTSATGKSRPEGDPFVVVGNRQLMQVGDRDPLAVNFQDSQTGIGVDTDQNVLYFRARKAFAPGAVNAFSMLVKNQPKATNAAKNAAKS